MLSGQSPSVVLSDQSPSVVLMWRWRGELKFVDCVKLRSHWKWLGWRLCAVSRATHMIDMHVIGHVPTSLHVSSVIFVWATSWEVTGGSQRFGGDLGNADLLTRASLAFIEIAVFPLLSFRAGVVLNSRGLVYFKAVQQWFLSMTRPDDSEFPYKNFCQQSRFAFLIVQKY